MLMFLQIFQRLHFDLSFADSLLHMPKFASTFKSLFSNKEKLFKLANNPLNENCSAVLLKKLPEKLGDPGKFLIPCDFLELDECLALADLGASINLMPLSFHFTADFVVINYDVDPRVPLILGRPFFRTVRALINVHGKELTLRVNDEAITFNVGHTSRYSYRYDDESVNRIDVIYVTCEEYAQEVLGFLDNSKSGNPTPSLDPIITTSSPSLTPFEGGYFVLKEIKACLTSDSIPPGIDDADFDSERDILLLEKLLNDNPSSPLPPKELNFEEIKIIKSLLMILRSLSSRTYLLILNSSLLLSSGSEDTIFDPGIPVFSFYSLDPVDCPDYEDSRAREIPSGESKVHIEVLSVLWENRLPIPDGSLPLSSRLKGEGNNNNKSETNKSLLDDGQLAYRCGSFQKGQGSPGQNKTPGQWSARNGYSQKDKNKAKKDKIEHEIRRA
ncbi:hypothetical protein Tco_0370740 [Tanacetum coccineum]